MVNKQLATEFEQQGFFILKNFFSLEETEALSENIKASP